MINDDGIIRAQLSMGVDYYKGENGVSPTISVVEIENGHRIIINDVDGEKSFDILDGEGGGSGGKNIISRNAEISFDGTRWTTIQQPDFSDITDFNYARVSLKATHNDVTNPYSTYLTLHPNKPGTAFCGYYDGGIYTLTKVGSNWQGGCVDLYKINNKANEVDIVRGEIGELYELLTEDTSSIVNAINEVQNLAMTNHYTLPTASTSTLGGVKVDGNTITINHNGVISAPGGGGSGSSVVYTAGNGISIDSGEISVNTDELVGEGEQVASQSYVDGAVSGISESIPTNVSELTNDAGYLTSYTETDPTVPSWAKQANKPTYTASEVGALPDTTTIPTNVSDLTNDSGFVNASGAAAAAPVQSVNGQTGAVVISGTAYFPFTVSGDTATPGAGVTAAAIYQAYTDGLIVCAKMSIGSSSNSTILPLRNAKYEDTYNRYTITFSGTTSSEFHTIDCVDEDGNAIWSYEREVSYNKKMGGIPKNDLAYAVQTSLGKADTALQSFTETDPTVPSWAKQSTKPTYTATEVGALPANTAIPQAISDLVNDSDFATETYVDNAIANIPSSGGNSYTAGTGISIDNGEISLDLTNNFTDECIVFDHYETGEVSGEDYPANETTIDSNQVQVFSYGEPDEVTGDREEHGTAITGEGIVFTSSEAGSEYLLSINDAGDLVFNNHALTYEGEIPQYSLPTASTSTLGGVKVDGSTITISNGVISATGGGSSSWDLSDRIAAGTGTQAVIEGNITQNQASGIYSHAEGFSTQATGNSSHAEGSSTQATNNSSHAEGSMTQATGYYSHAEGWSTKASGSHSHAEGYGSTAEAQGAHAEGRYTHAMSDYQHVEGRRNIADTNGVFQNIAGNGTMNVGRISTMFARDWNGNEYLAGNLYVGCNEYSTTSTGLVTENAGGSKVATEDYVDTAIANIPSSGSSYTAGDGISIDENNVISAKTNPLIFSMLQMTAAGNNMPLAVRLDNSSTWEQFVDNVKAGKVVYISTSTSYTFSESYKLTPELLGVSNLYALNVDQLSVPMMGSTPASYSATGTQVYYSTYYYFDGEFLWSWKDPENLGNFIKVRYKTYKNYALGKALADINTDISAITTRIPTAPTTDGDYTLRCIVSNGTPNYSWMSGNEMPMD